MASTLQTALRATSATDLDNVEVDYDSAASAFVVTLPLDSSGVVPTASAAFTGDDADELGLDTATIVNGVDAITSGTVTFLSQTVTSLDFSDVTDYDDVASVLQTALRATSSTDLDNAEVTHDGAAFVVTLPLDSSGVVPTASAAFTDDDADELGLDTATIVNGVDAIKSATVTFLSQTVTQLELLQPDGLRRCGHGSQGRATGSLRDRPGPGRGGLCGWRVRHHHSRWRPMAIPLRCPAR